MHTLLWISRTSVIVVLVLNQLVFHLLVLMIWGFVVPIPDVTAVAPSVSDVGTQKPGYVSPLPCASEFTYASVSTYVTRS